MRRTDVVVYSSTLKPLMIVECKAPSVQLTQTTFDQTARYNMTLGVAYFILTNGIDVLCCTIDHENQSYIFMKEVPFYTELIK